MRSTIESEIRARVEAFADELVSLIQTSALEAVQGALGEEGGRRRGRAAPALASPASGRGGGKRDPQVIAALTDELHAFISKNPGKRIEEIGAALQTPTRDLVLPVRRLIASKRVSTRGQKRATTYFVASGRGGASKKKAGRSPARASKKRAKRGAGKPRGRAASKRRRGADTGGEKASEAAAAASAE